MHRRDRLVGQRAAEHRVVADHATCLVGMALDRLPDERASGARVRGGGDQRDVGGSKSAPGTRRQPRDDQSDPLAEPRLHVALVAEAVAPQQLRDLAPDRAVRLVAEQLVQRLLVGGPLRALWAHRQRGVDHRVRRSQCGRIERGGRSTLRAAARGQEAERGSARRKPYDEPPPPPHEPQDTDRSSASARASVTGAWQVKCSQTYAAARPSTRPRPASSGTVGGSVSPPPAMTSCGRNRVRTVRASKPAPSATSPTIATSRTRACANEIAWSRWPNALG